MSSTLRDRAMYVVVLVLGAAWAVWHLRNSFLFYDEWSIVGHILHRPTQSLVFQEHNGHMWVLSSLMYRLQLYGWGVQSHWFLNSVMVGSLVVLHAALTRLLRGLSVTPFTAVLLAGVVTYLGAAGQNIVFAVQFSLMLSLAIGALAIGTVLRCEATARTRLLVAVLAALSVLVENGGSLVFLPMLTVLLIGAWGRRSVALAVPAWVVAAAWYVLAPAGPSYGASAAQSARFAGRLLLVSIGSLVGRTARVGLMMLVVIVAISAFALVKGWLDARTRWLWVGVLASVTSIVGAITMSRAGLPGVGNFVDYNRYLQCVALPIVIAAVPGFVACWQHRPAQWGLRSTATVVAGPALAMVLFALGIGPLRAYDERFDSWNHATRRGVHDIAVVLRDGCPSGAAPDLASRPLRYLGPMLSGQEVADLIAQGYLDVPDDALLNGDPETGVVGPLCPTG